VFSFHRPGTLLAWVQQEKQLAQRLREFPALAAGTLWPAQIQAINSLENSFAKGRPRALIQMATGATRLRQSILQKAFIGELAETGG
jgi:type I restriction enzyme R subunit